MIRVAFRGSGHNLNLCGSGVAESPKPGRDRLHASGHHRFGPWIDKTDSWGFRRLLRAPSEGPSGRRAARTVIKTRRFTASPSGACNEG